MVENVSSSLAYDPIAYLNKVKGITPPAAPKPPVAAGPATNANNPLQSPNPVNVNSDILSLLQGTSPASFQSQQLSSLLGGTGKNNALGGLFNVALASNSSLAPIQNALASLKQQQAQLSTKTDFIAKATANQHAATNAYNKTLLQNAHNAIVASYQNPPVVA